MLFWILTKLNFAPILISWKKILYLENFSNQNRQLTFLDETFYHTHMLLFSKTISAAVVIKATKYSMYYIIHNSHDVVTKYSTISTKKWTSHLVVSVDKNNVYFHLHCLLPKYWKLLPLSHTFIDHAVKHEKI